MNTLDRELRRKLDKTVREARRAAEAGAGKVLEQFAVGRHEPHAGMHAEARELRNRLRAHARQLGDRRDPTRGTQAIDRLLRECAYEHWHRMLFARFLAESDLLIEPESGVPISLEECRELAREEGVDWLALASDYAERMLPQIFRKDGPVLAISLPPETRSHLEELLKDLPRDVFTAEDSLGWVYQFWQADQKDAVNRSGEKIGADELPAVTQLFTEDYMVLFLLHNTLGAWWAGKVLADDPDLAASAGTEDELRAACAVGGVKWSYLRFVREETEDGSEGPWRPAAGAFERWPKAAKEITVFDPCMGSGQFLVFALPILVAFRIAEEELDETPAVEAVLRDNLYGLEIDPRCTQIAAFNLAFTSWRRVGFHPLPPLNLACSGLAIGVTKAEWLRLAAKAVEAIDPGTRRDLLGADNIPLTQGLEERLGNGLEALYDLFSKAPWLGSLIDPRRTRSNLFSEGFDRLEALIGPILKSADTEETREMAVAAQGMSKAANILASSFVLTTTNVPYLKAGNQDETIKKYCQREHKVAKYDLATVFADRITSYGTKGQSSAIVSQQYWLFLKYYQKFRENVIKSQTVNLLSVLGPGAFDGISGDIVNVCLQIKTNERCVHKHKIHGLDVSFFRGPHDKGYRLANGKIRAQIQIANLDNPDSRISLEYLIEPGVPTIATFSDFGKGSVSGDGPHYLRKFWEFSQLSSITRPWLNSPTTDDLWSGREHVILWGDEPFNPEVEIGFRHHGQRVFGRRGIAIGKAGQLRFCHYNGELFDDNLAVLCPRDDRDIEGLWEYCLSGEFERNIWKLDRKMSVTAGTFSKVPYDRGKWAGDGSSGSSIFGASRSRSLTQWIFDGYPTGAAQPLQVGVARLLGYRWPRQMGASFVDWPALEPDGLEDHADEDGIVCLDALKGEAAAEQRLISLFSEAYGDDWSTAKLDTLLAETGFGGRTIGGWLRDSFFVEHSKLFKQRPFIWHIWDGRRDGFHALVNYHRLAAPDGRGRNTFDKLVYSYLGDWIDRQHSDVANGVEGADARLAHAQHLQDELIRIQSGEPPYDIFVRWKPLHEQPIGWEPDINDGVGVNIRPFMTAQPLGGKGKNACILRAVPKIKWQKRRGTDRERSKEDYPWFWGWDGVSVDFAGGAEFDGNRWNDLHYSNAFKQAARDRRQT